MKKTTLSLLALLLLTIFAVSAQAQTILSEDFETSSTESTSLPVTAGAGWTVVNSYTGDHFIYNWHNNYNKDGAGTGGGKHVAVVDAPTYESSPYGGFGPREETLLSPELDLNDTYELSFDWAAGPMAANPDTRFDLQVRIVENDDLQDAETIFSIHNPQLLKESGVLKWNEDWAFYNSRIDLSEWKGQKVKIAFVYKMFTTVGNQVSLDNISVYRVEPVTGPVATLSTNSYKFTEMYIGEKFYTEPIVLKNTGKGNLTVSSADLPDGVGVTIDFANVNLERNDEVRFQLTYTAKLTNSSTPTVVLHTTGGDASIALSATKTFVPEGYTLESFEGYFPSAGWRSSNWSATDVALEGDQSAQATRDITVSYLTTPRLDLTNGGDLTFTYYDYFESEDGGSYPNNDFMVQVSTDGGSNWRTLWTASYEFTTSYQATKTISLPAGTDNSYVRFVLTDVEYDSDEGAAEGRDIYLDRVLLPNLYGQGGAPGAATLLKPANNAQNVYPRDIVLSWGPAQFANGYKIYVGSNEEATNLIDGVDVKDALTYTIARADYETTYNWKVVAYNAAGDAQDVATWKFTTQPDASVANYPYIEDFKEKEIPTGWLAVAAPTYNRNWYVNTYFPFKSGNIQSNALTSSYVGADEEANYILTPEFNLPADKTMQISFFWGDEHPSDLLVDETGLLKKQNIEPNNGVSEGIFSILVDDQWIDLTSISEDASLDKKYWREEVVNLAAYAGKTVQFRWTHIGHRSSPDGGTSVAHVVLEVIEGDKAIFNKPSWDAGKVNYGKGNSSGEVFTVLNKGINELKVKGTSFATDNFETTLAAGTVIPVDGGATFGIQFNAKDANKVVEDALTIEFESGYKATLPVRGQGLAQDVLYYDFEPNALDYLWRDDFTMIDADNAVNYDLGYYETIVENDGTRYAFTNVEHRNSNLTAYSGSHTIMAATPSNGGGANDWLISKQLHIAEGATFDFYARNLGTANSVFIGDNDYHSVGVYVSETGNTSTSDFKAVLKDTQMDYLGENQWHHFTVDLAPYAGKNIYVAVRHTTVSANWVAFFDEFTFTHVAATDGTGIVQLADEGQAADRTTIFDLSGRRLTKGQATKGLYIVNGKKILVK